MPKSRYDRFNRVRGNSGDYFRLETFPSISIEELANIPHNIIMWKETDNMPALAEDHLGSSKYWWVICMMNNLVSPFSYDLLPGTLLKIPHEANSIINIIQRKQGSK